MEQYSITVYYHSSESSYTFGPMEWNEANRLYSKMEKDSNCGDPLINLLNSPSVYGTGDEIG